MKINFVLPLLLIITLGSCITPGGRERPKDFTVNLESTQIDLGQIEAQFDTFLGIGGIQKDTVDIVYFPKENALCLRYRRDFITYYQFWNAPGRAQFLYALHKYNEDYNARNFNSRSGIKELQSYGIIRSYLIWQSLSFTVQAKANMDIYLGYNFKERTPYFVTSQRDAEFVHHDTRDMDRTSAIMNMYFTRAQAAELAVYFDESYLSQAALGKTQTGNTSDTSADRDEY